MTGKDLIVYILANDLENKEIRAEDLDFLGYIPASQFAILNGIGRASVETLCLRGDVPFVTIGSKVYVPNKPLEQIKSERRLSEKY